MGGREMTNVFTVDVNKEQIDKVMIFDLIMFHRECGGKNLKKSFSTPDHLELSCDRCDTNILVPLTYNDKLKLIGVATKGLEAKIEGKIRSNIEEDKNVTVIFIQK
jgi:hypothetical protein